MTVIAVVTYGRVADMDKRRRCQRCEGTGRDRATGFVDPCPRCPDSPGIRIEGWNYRVPDGLELAVGDRVEVPPTPHTRGENATATVLDVRPRVATDFIPRSEILRRLPA